ncbi:MAG: plastocyanin [Acidimicrobiales bacterium]|nr:plastocyanin [Acidimicrobiales bacterium]
MNSTSLPVGRVLRIIAAVAILISGIVHLDLYFNADYRFASPDVNFGRSILLNGFGAGIVAIALVARKEWFVRLAGIGYALSTIVLFWYTHSGHTFLGFSHGGPVFEPSPQAQLSVIMGIIAIVALAASFVPAIDAADAPSGLPVVGVAFTITAIALIGLTLKWKPDDATTPSAAPTTTVATAGTTTDSTPATTAATTAGSTVDTTAGSTAGSTAPATGGSAVSIKDFKFDAVDLTVAKGTTVTWTNGDKQAHTATSSGNFDTGSIAAGATGTATFDTAGTFAYICSFHPFMKGTITVTG